MSGKAATPPPSSPPTWFQQYRDRGFKLYRYPQKQKGPSGKDGKNWTTQFAEDYQPDSNWGVALGAPLAPGRFLIDIDFDWPEGIVLGRRLLQPTSFVFGRASKPISHAFYTTDAPLALRKFEDVDGQCLVEMRGAKKDGSIGFQTMLPPSVHPNGEIIEMRLDGDIVHDPAIERHTILYAIACIFLRHLGVAGLNHDNRLALAGFLLSEGIEEPEVIAIGEAIAEATGNDVSDVALTVKTTAARVRGHEHVKGRQTLIKALGEKGKHILTRVREWLGGGLWIEDPKTGKPIPNNQENIRRAVEKLDAKLSYDQFSQRMLLDYGTYTGLLDDKFRNRLWLDIEKHFHFRPTQDYFDIVIQDIAYGNEFHPVLDYLRGLVWDKKPRLDRWLVDYAKAADTDFVRAVSSMVLIAAVRRVREPGCKFDELLILESGQGMLKSSALKSLCPDDAWFSDDLPLDVDAKQIIERTLGKWVIEVGELAGMRSSQVELLKASLSRQVDGPVRMAYGRMSVERARQFICIGTTNSEIYLKDITGNRRFWPVRVEGFDLAGLRAVRDQLWAEAAYREEHGESIRLPPELYEHASFQQERRRVEDPWEARLEERFTPDRKWRLTPDEVWNAVGVTIDRRDGRGNERLLHIMTRLGFRRLTVVVRDEDTGKEKGRVKGFGRDILVGQLELEDGRE